MKQSISIRHFLTVSSLVARVHFRSSGFRWSTAFGLIVPLLILMLGGPFLAPADHLQLAVGTGLYTFGLIWAALPSPWRFTTARTSMWPGRVGMNDWAVASGWGSVAFLGNFLIVALSLSLAPLLIRQPIEPAVAVSLVLSGTSFCTILSAWIFLGSTVLGPTTGRFVALVWLVGGPICAEAARGAGLPNFFVGGLEGLARSSPLEASSFSGHRLLTTLALAGSFSLLAKAFHQFEMQKGRKLTDRVV